MSIEENEGLGDQVDALFLELETTAINYTEWEEDFINDMKIKWDKGTSFSVVQIKYIERLYSKYIEGSSTEITEDTYDKFKKNT